MIKLYFRTDHWSWSSIWMLIPILTVLTILTVVSSLAVSIPKWWQWSSSPHLSTSWQWFLAFLSIVHNTVHSYFHVIIICSYPAVGGSRILGWRVLNCATESKFDHTHLNPAHPFHKFKKFMTKFVATYMRYIRGWWSQVYKTWMNVQKIWGKWSSVKVKNSEILNTQGRAILLDVCGWRQLKVCQNPDLLWGVPVWLLAKKRRETLCWGNACDCRWWWRKRKKYGHSLLEGKCLLLWHRKMRKRRCTLSWGGGTCDCNHCWIIIRLRREPNIDIMHWISCIHIADFSDIESRDKYKLIRHISKFHRLGPWHVS